LAQGFTRRKKPNDKSNNPGLFGLASFVAGQRSREIGVRKILGATLFNLWKMLSKDFVLLVGLSCLIAIPIAWWLLHQWLQR
jgi:putative ABC transport system permease protein